jgi:hypothetical protein
MLDKVTAALAAIRGEGTFALEQACPSDDLHLEVEGVGPIPFPIRPATARKLIAAARPAPFGRRDRTLHDTSVRDTWEIGARQIKIEARSWSRALARELEQIREGLGLPEAGKLTARLDKMLLYEPGQFFAPHQDSERHADMIGSLVVELPSASSGGAVIIEHGGERKTLRGAPREPRDLSLLAFYADCRHEVTPLESGFRIVLTYHLLYRRAPGTEAPSAPGAAVDRVTDSVKAYFATPIQDPYSKSAPQKPDRLIFLLDHEYTEKSIGWDRLKSADRPRDDLLAFLTAPGTGLPLMTAGKLLEEWQKGRTPASMKALGLGDLHRYSREGLARALAAPPRRPDDWSIEPPSRCKCDLCRELAAFLRAPDRIEHAWPLAQDKRRHVHHTIDAHQLPVSHVTTRRGRPYTLVLRKEHALFQREQALRSREKARLAWLEKHPL